MKIIEETIDLINFYYREDEIKNEINNLFKRVIDKPKSLTAKESFVLANYINVMRSYAMHTKRLETVKNLIDLKNYYLENI